MQHFQCRIGHENSNIFVQRYTADWVRQVCLRFYPPGEDCIGVILLLCPFPMYITVYCKAFTHLPLLNYFVLYSILESGLRDKAAVSPLLSSSCLFSSFSNILPPLITSQPPCLQAHWIFQFVSNVWKTLVKGWKWPDYSKTHDYKKLVSNQISPSPLTIFPTDS